MRAVDQRLASLEGRFQRDLTSLRTDTGKQLSDLETFFKNLEKRLGKIDDAISKADADLRTAILEHTKSVTVQLKKVSDDFSAELLQAVTELRGEKLDTATLIQLFTDKYHSTVGVKIDRKEVDLDGTAVNLVLWDLVDEWRLGQGDYNALLDAGFHTIGTSAKTGEGVEDAFLWLASATVKA